MPAFRYCLRGPEKVHQEFGIGYVHLSRQNHVQTPNSVLQVFYCLADFGISMSRHGQTLPRQSRPLTVQNPQPLLEVEGSELRL